MAFLPVNKIDQMLPFQVFSWAFEYDCGLEMPFKIKRTRINSFLSLSFALIGNILSDVPGWSSISEPPCSRLWPYHTPSIPAHTHTPPGFFQVTKFLCFCDFLAWKIKTQKMFLPKIFLRIFCLFLSKNVFIFIFQFLLEPVFLSIESDDLLQLEVVKLRKKFEPL